MIYDVVAVNINSGTVRVLATDKTLADAEAIVNLAVMKRGVEEEFYGAMDSGFYRDGDHWTGWEVAGVEG